MDQDQNQTEMNRQAWLKQPINPLEILFAIVAVLAIVGLVVVIKKHV